MEDNFVELYTEQPDRGDELEDELSNVSESASERESYSPNESDLISVLKRLFPSYDDDKL